MPLVLCTEELFCKNLNLKKNRWSYYIAIYINNIAFLCVCFFWVGGLSMFVFVLCVCMASLIMGLCMASREKCPDSKSCSSTGACVGRV